ncbi:MULTISPECIES: hypothetical protein [unclassified Lysobacter]|uniref:hypothetical protein n=1 Tax=unclassified Lysobacter TaxID=2635362 RepID=UPI001BE785EF|nr:MULTISPECIES: hypothetical protein [unclassified Lysobacter]MBT2749096.1 hypothetical protein [Lysobacter sp. ISL-42]MBT2751410.1 hypothetical protein [Lysobacter sp. ISL-50]MBT2777352.1 hypothetical protein [Lysobacter sp. ISL-54]MBT2781572.1 hypothetical protein [Lysobacter sp. ISL-52]
MQIEILGRPINVSATPQVTTWARYKHELEAALRSMGRDGMALISKYDLIDCVEVPTSVCVRINVDLEQLRGAK